MIKCPKCGNDNLDNAVYCSSCGINIKNYEKKNILLVEAIATSNFFLTKTFKNRGFDVKSLKNPGFVFDELSSNDYHAFIIDIDLSDKTNLGFLKTLKKLHPNQYTIIITPQISKEELSTLKSLGFTVVLVKPVKTETILSYVDKNKSIKKEKSEFKYHIFTKDNIEKAILPYIKDNDITYFIVFALKDFSKENIMSNSISSMLDRIFNSIKRSDKFLLIEDIGFIIIPTEHIAEKGVIIFKNRLEKLVDNNLLSSSGILKYPYRNLTPNDICSMIVQNNLKQQQKEIIIEKKQRQILKDIPEEMFFKDKHLVFSALNHMKDEDVALLYLSDNFKKIVAPFITISQAKIIKKLKESKKTSTSEDRFIKTLKEIAEINNSYKNDGVEERIKSDISLMTLPEIQNNIIMLINEEASFKRIVSELQKDAAISSKVLKLVNSAFFGFPRQIKNLERAAAILGTEEILGLSLSISYMNSFNKNVSFVKKLWRENIAIMSIIQFIENEYKISTSSITPSILSSIGKIFFSQYFPEQYINTIKEAQKTGLIYDAVELKHFSSPHTTVGSTIIDMWNLPEKIKLSALYHTYPSAYSKLNTSLHLIHASKYIAGALGYSTTPQPIENMGYYTYTMLLKKHGVDIKNIYEEQADELKRYIEDMMFLLL